VARHQPDAAGSQAGRQRQAKFLFQTGFLEEKIMSGWVGVDLDGTLARYDGWQGVDKIGAPIPSMVRRVKAMLADGHDVRIFTARMHGHGKPLVGGGVEDVLTPIQEWCQEHIGQVLPVTNVKDFGMIRLYDDRCVQVESNTGRIIKDAGAHDPYDV